MNPVHITPPYFCNIHLSIILPLRVGLSTGLYPSGSPTKTLYASLFSPMRATCPDPLTLLDLIAVITFGEKYKL
jgi:hypothetical protein